MVVRLFHTETGCERSGSSSVLVAISGVPGHKRSVKVEVHTERTGSKVALPPQSTGSPYPFAGYLSKYFVAETRVAKRKLNHKT